MTTNQVTEAIPVAPPTQADYTWNAYALALDMAMFNIGMSFVSATAVLPAFIATLTDSEVLVGLASGLYTGGWLLPQLVIASIVARIPRKKPIIVRAAWFTRPILLLIALVVWLSAARIPALALAAVMLGIFSFFIGDAVVSVPWFDLVAKALPSRRRGRVLGLGQVIGGLGGIGAGVIVRLILSEQSPWTFPANYALLFVLAAVFVLFSAVMLSVVREPDGKLAIKEVATARQVFAAMPRILAHDRAFTRLIVVRLFSGFASVASAFYILHATANLGFGVGVTGLFVSAQVMGSMMAGLVMSTVQDRWGPRVHIRLVIALAVAPPIIALIVTQLAGALGATALYPYLAVFFFLGIYGSSAGWPFYNWVLEHTESTWRPVYIGLLNTLAATVMLAPALGGWIVDTISYPAVFCAALVFSLVALALSLTLPSTRRQATAQPDEGGHS